MNEEDFDFSPAKEEIQLDSSGEDDEAIDVQNSNQNVKLTSEL